MFIKITLSKICMMYGKRTLLDLLLRTLLDRLFYSIGKISIVFEKCKICLKFIFKFKPFMYFIMLMIFQIKMKLFENIELCVLCEGT